MDWNNPLIHSVLVIVAITIAFLSIMLLVAATVLAERRVLAFIQGRLGPNRVGYGGVLQPFADFIKTMMKEDCSRNPPICFHAGAEVAVSQPSAIVCTLSSHDNFPFTNWSFLGDRALRCGPAITSWGSTSFGSTARSRRWAF